MVRVINQETFDDVVKENIEEFEMTVEEAVQEAVQQFEAQVVYSGFVMLELNFHKMLLQFAVILNLDIVTLSNYRCFHLTVR